MDLKRDSPVSKSSKQLKTNTICLNCGYSLPDFYKFCPGCGQQNTSSNLSVGEFLTDVFSNYFSYDSRFVRSLVPFLVKPGYLTSRFVQGKRLSYINPVRLYILVSFFHFFLLSFYLDREDNINIYSPTGNNNLTLSLNSPADTISKGDIQVGGSLDLEDEEMQQELAEEIGPRIAAKIQKIIKNQQSFIEFIVKNLSILMFFLLPLLAAVLRFTYRKTFPYYISHLVHSLHLHSFMFLCLGISYMVDFSGLNIDLSLIIFSILLIYSYFSFKLFYQQGFLKTFRKWLLTGISYGLVLFAGLILEILVSIWLF
jgi:hypothetical protein